MSIHDHLLRVIPGTHPSGKLRSESPPPGFDFLPIGCLADPAFSSTRAASWFVCAALCLCACAAQRAQEEETSAPDANTPDAVEQRPVGEAFATELSLRDCTGSSRICSIERLSLPSTPVAKDEPGLALSADGSVLVVSTQEGVLLVDRKNSTCAPILARDGTPLGGTGLSISADGSIVAFVSPGPWLASGGSGDLLYVYERAKDDLVAVNVDADGQSKVSEGHASSRESEGF
ncbi:MAG: hypothetical protein RBU37_26225, partial [Myxococcota bacterium]|nr:hypothetical protein [Myxococcota bacterium]